jgi:O-antigen ligase
MPEHIRAFIVVFALSVVALSLYQRALAPTTEGAVLRSWRSLWLLGTSAAFLSHSFWLFALVLAVLLYTRKLEPQRAFASYLLLLLVTPPAGITISGLGVINQLFQLNNPRLLAIVLLLPAFWKIFSSSASFPLRTRAHAWMWGYLVLVALMCFRGATFTDGLRGAFYQFLDVFLPFYVALHSLRDVKDFRLVMSALVAAAAVLGLVAVFEFLRGWSLYNSVVDVLGLSWGMGGYITRDGLLRAAASAGQPIVFGYVMAVAFGAWLFVGHGARRSFAWYTVGAMLLGGAAVSLSRGPWLGLLLIYLVYLALSPQATKKILGVVLFGVAALGLAAVTSTGQRFISMLPFLGDVDSENVEYRQRLVDNALIVIERNLFLGSEDYLQSAEMQRMIQGQGIIDVVNTYLGFALDYGLVGLFLFCMVFWGAGFSALAAVKRLVDRNSSEAILGRALVGTLAGILLIIATVSSISVIPQYYWAFAGMCYAYANAMYLAPRPAISLNPVH